MSADKLAFKISLTFPTLMFFLLALILFSMALGYALTSPLEPGLIGGTFVGMMGLFFLYPFTKYQRIRVKSAHFYENHFELAGKELSKEGYYSEIQQVDLVKPHSFWSPQIQLHVYLKGEQTPLILISNPTSKLLRTDLFSWLQGKIEG